MVSPLIGLSAASQVGGLASGLMGLMKTGQERTLEDELRRQMAGRGSSASEAFFRRQVAANQNLATQLSSQEGVNPALAQRQASQAASQGLAQISGQAAERRAQEAESARQQFGSQIVPSAQRRRAAIGMSIGTLMNTLGTQGAIAGAQNPAATAGEQPAMGGSPEGTPQAATALGGLMLPGIGGDQAQGQESTINGVPVTDAGSPEALQQLSQGVVGQLRAASARGTISPQLLQGIEQQLTQTGTIDPSVMQFIQEKIAAGELPPALAQQIQMLSRPQGSPKVGPSPVGHQTPAAPVMSPFDIVSPLMNLGR